MEQKRTADARERIGSDTARASAQNASAPRKTASTAQRPRTSASRVTPGSSAQSGVRPRTAQTAAQRTAQQNTRPSGSAKRPPEGVKRTAASPQTTKKKTVPAGTTVKPRQNGAPSAQNRSPNGTSKQTAARTSVKNGATSTSKRTVQAQKPKPKALTPEQKARMEARRKAQAAARKRMLARLWTVTVIFLTCYAAVSLALAGILWANFRHVSAEDQCPIMIYQPKKDPLSTSEKEKVLYECPAETANINGSLYIPYTVLSKLTNVGMVGDRRQLTIELRDYGDTLKCYAGSSSVEINGVPASLSVPVIRKGEEYYFPVEILEKYVSGVSVTYEKDSKGNGFCKITLSQYGGSVSFNNHSDSGTDSVSEPESSQE